jgi:vitamin B12 transporter
MPRFSLACSLLLIPTPLAAQQPGDTVELAPVVVTATRVPMRRDAVPVSVTVLTGAELAAQGVRTVFEALRDVPGATIVQTGSFGGQTSLFLRGGNSNYVKVLVDGVPVNQPGGAFDFANLTTDNVERIEVVRGPASVLYGSDAVTGVVQIFTRRGIGAARGAAGAGGGTYGTRDWTVATSGGTQAASYSFAASRLTSDGMYAFNNRYRNTGLSGLLHFAWPESTEATLTIRYDDGVYHFPTNGAGRAVDHNQFTHGQGPTIGLDVGHYFTARLETRLLVAVNATNGGYDNPPDSAADSTLFRSVDKRRRVATDLRANLYFPARGVLTAGATVEQQRDQSSNLCRTAFGDCSSPPIDTARWNGAVYAQGLVDVTDRGSLTAGIRLEDNQRFGTYATFRVGGTYRIAGSTRLRASGGNGFREPSFFENYATGYSVGNPNLRPEHSQSWELGLEQWIAAGQVGLNATVFDQRFVDLIDYNPSAASGTPNYQNVAAATASGVELGFHAAPASSPGHALSVGVSYTYLHTAVTNPGFDSSSGAALAAGRPLVRRPRHAARLELVDRLGGRRGTVALAVTYVGAREDQDFATFPFPRVTLPAYARADLAASLDLVRARGTAPGVAVSVRVENLFDRVYEEVKNFPARRRTLLFGGQLRFGT